MSDYHSTPHFVLYNVCLSVRHLLTLRVFTGIARFYALSVVVYVVCYRLYDRRKSVVAVQLYRRLQAHGEWEKAIY